MFPLARVPFGVPIFDPQPYITQAPQGRVRSPATVESPAAPGSSPLRGRSSRCTPARSPGLDRSGWGDQWPGEHSRATFPILSRDPSCFMKPVRGGHPVARENRIKQGTPFWGGKGTFCCWVCFKRGTPKT